MNRSPWSALLVMLLGGTSAEAQVKLAWQFREGETFFAEQVHVHKQSVEIKGKRFQAERTKTWLTAFTVKKATAAGFVLDLAVESAGFQSTGVSPRGSPAAPAGVNDALAAKIKGSSFTATITPQGKLLKFEGYDAFIRKLAAKNEESAKALKALLSEESLREEVEDIFHFLPEKPVRKGDKWKRAASEPVPPFGSFQSVFEFVLTEDVGKVLSIGTTIRMTYKPPGGDGDLFRVVQGSLKADEAKGSIVFDARRGRLVNKEITVHVRGDLIVESMGIQTRMEFASDNTSRVRVFAKNEAKKE